VTKKSFLLKLACRNKAKGKVKRVRKESNNPLYLNRQQKRLKNKHNKTSATETVAARAAASTPRRISTGTANDNNVNDFARVFGHVQISAALLRKAKEFSAQAQCRAETRRQETGDAGGNDGHRIFSHQGSAIHTQMAPNHGQTSRIEPQQFGSDGSSRSHDQPKFK